MFLFPFRNPSPKISIRPRGGRQRGTAHGCTIPPLPPPSPPFSRGERVEGVGGCNTKFSVEGFRMIRRTFWAPPPHRAGALGAAPAPNGGWRRPKRKFIPGNSISLIPERRQKERSRRARERSEAFCRAFDAQYAQTLAQRKVYRFRRSAKAASMVGKAKAKPASKSRLGKAY